MSCSSQVGYTSEEKERIVRDGPCSCDHCVRETAQAQANVSELEEKKQEVERRLKVITDTQRCLDNVVSEARVQLALKQLSTTKNRLANIRLAEQHYDEARSALLILTSEIRMVEDELSSIEADLQVVQETYRQMKDASTTCYKDSERFLQST